MSIKHLISEYGAAELLGITHYEVRKLVRLNRIPFIRLPVNEIRFDPDDLWKWAESFKQPVPSAATPQTIS